MEKKLLALLMAGFMLTASSCQIVDNLLNNTPPVVDDGGGSTNVTPEHVHSLSYVRATEASKYEHGSHAYYRCGCGKLFTDKQCKNETTLEKLIIRSETGFDKQYYTSDRYTLNYCLYEPKDIDKENDKLPLVLFLHGAGERGSDNEAQLKNAILKVVGDSKNNQWSNSVIIAPQCPSSTGGNTNSDVNDPNKWVETPWNKGNYVQANVPESRPMQAVAELVKQYADLDYIDSGRVYVVGRSMGGFGTWDIISRYPDLFTAAVPICGGGPTDKIDVLKNIPIYTFHGSSDSVVPYSGTQGMYNAIKAAGGDQILFHTFSGAGHNIWDQAITFGGGGGLPSLEEWLFSQGDDNAENVEKPKTYGFDVSEEDDVFSSVVDNNGPDGNGRFTNKKHTDAVFYELTQGASFTVDVTASKDAQASFIIKMLGSGKFSYQDLVKSISVTNGGKTENVSINNGEAELIGWYITQNNTVRIDIADISLKEGKNTVTFTMGNNNVNIAGVEFVTTAEITHQPARSEYGNSIESYDPFIAANGGSILTNGSATQKANNENGVFYMNNQKSTFTFTVNAKEATDAVLSLGIVFNNSNGYSTRNIITSVTSLDRNGEANTVVISDAITVKCANWNYTQSLRADFATISLKEGVNTITFTFGTDNVNISGVYLRSDSEIVFGIKD
jgi:predicted esterase